jgi:hypothetical protein
VNFMFVLILFLFSRKEKYEKLKKHLNQGPKHDFNDVDYLRKKDLVLDQTEDALEAVSLFKLINRL